MIRYIFLDGSEITITIDQKVRLMVEVIFKVLALYLFLFAVRLLIPTFNQFLIYFILVLLESIDYRFINLRKVLFWNKFEIGNLFTFRSLTKKLKISPRTGFRVEKWWKKFFYRPKPSWRAVISGRNYTILILTCLFHINYFGSIDFESWAILIRASCDIL